MNDSDKPPSGNRRVVVDFFDPRRSASWGADLLESAGLPYALVGRLAVWAYVAQTHEGMHTKDVDFAVPVEHMAALEAALGPTGARTRPLRIGGIRAETDDGIRVDFIDRRFHLAALFREAVEAARALGAVAEVGERALPLVPAEHLVAMKMAPGTPKDDADVERLLGRLPTLDYQAARALVERHLGPIVGDRLDELARHAGRADVPPRGPYDDS